MVKGVVAILGAAVLAGACAPTFDDATSIVSGPRLLAVQSVPAEASLGSPFALTALYVGPGGPVAASSLDWAECLLQPPSDQPGPINPACFVATSPALVPIGTGGSVSATVPEDACELFGPDAPPPEPGQPSPRPTDPDATGGFYLPVRIGTSSGSWSAAPERITCPPSGVTQDIFTVYSDGYIPNENPAVASLSAGTGDASPALVPPDAGSAGPLTVRQGQGISLTVAWSPCPSSPQACSGAETYLSIDPATHTVVALRESIVASWYATGGTFGVDRSGRAQDDLATTASNEWTTPHVQGSVHLWVVLRDARGGVGWQSYTVDVRP